MAARYCLALYILTPPAVVGSLAAYAIDRKLSDLEAIYPALPVNDSTCSEALRTPNFPSTQHSPHIDIYSARIFFKDLGLTVTPKLTQNWHEPEVIARLKASNSTLWARWVLQGRIMRWEEKIIGLLSGNGFHPGDNGGTPRGFAPVADLVPIATAEERQRERPRKGEQPGQKRKLLHGVLTVERPPSTENPYGLLVSWKMADGPRLFFERIARWGYPWRLMSGGRHEFSVSDPYLVPGEEDRGHAIDVRFASAHDYEIVPEEGDLEKQKTIPNWSARLHRGYAMFILDQSVRDLLFAGSIIIGDRRSGRVRRG
ncbi:uncharacterized protein BDV17DRAFT_208609 [Aspergillus undulatus]|uniref:uncharacterized protein n=1 Tax=Aspergillus undulatus TaxID=1810928 RepID=UPI003CCE2A13